MGRGAENWTQAAGVCRRRRCARGRARGARAVGVLNQGPTASLSPPRRSSLRPHPGLGIVDSRMPGSKPVRRGLVAARESSDCGGASLDCARRRRRRRATEPSCSAERTVLRITCATASLKGVGPASDPGHPHQRLESRHSNNPLPRAFTACSAWPTGAFTCLLRPEYLHRVRPTPYAPGTERHVAAACEVSSPAPNSALRCMCTVLGRA